MSKRFSGLFVLFGTAVLAVANPVTQKDRPSAEDRAKAEKGVKEELAKLKGEVDQVQQVKDETVDKVFPRSLFFVARFQQFPVARVPPEGLSRSNLFAVDREGTVQLMKDAKGLEAFSKTKLPEVSEDTAAKAAARAWVRLSQEYWNDGFYKFALMDEATKVSEEKGKKLATAKVVAMASGNGAVTATLTFDNGKLAQVAEEGKLRPGPRPICQATKLLDKDPLVRRMAEQDLLIMGRAARVYLDEQRAKAAPALREAIDAVWKKIVEEDH
jgi:hypothetical protein